MCQNRILRRCCITIRRVFHANSKNGIYISRNSFPAKIWLVLHHLWSLPAPDRTSLYGYVVKVAILFFALPLRFVLGSIFG
jgi:hypothetical protein